MIRYLSPAHKSNNRISFNFLNSHFSVYMA